jgi:C-1 hydroxylase
MSEKNKALVRELSEEIWNGRKLERIPDFYAPDYVVDYRPYVPVRTGREAIRETVERAFATFPDYHEEIRELIAEGDKVVVCLTISGTQTGQ